MKRPPEPPKRRRILRRTLSVERAAEIMEHTFGLPEGSVRLTLPDRRLPRRDMTVGSLRQRWDQVS